MVLSSEAIVENKLDVQISNDKEFKDPSSGSLNMPIHTVSVGDYMNGNEENGKGKGCAIFIEDGPVQDTVETKENDTNYLSNERHDTRVVGGGAVGLKVELMSKETGNAIGKETNLISKHEEKSDLRNAGEVT